MGGTVPMVPAVPPLPSTRVASERREEVSVPGHSACGPPAGALPPHFTSSAWQ